MATKPVRPKPDIVHSAAARCAMNVSELAEATGIPYQTMAAWRNRKRIPPTGRALLQILLAMGNDALQYVIPEPKRKK